MADFDIRTAVGTRARREGGRPAWFWPALVGMILLPIGVAVWLMIDAQGVVDERVTNAPPPTATATPAAAATTPAVAATTPAVAATTPPAAEPAMVVAAAPDAGASAIVDVAADAGVDAVAVAVVDVDAVAVAEAVAVAAPATNPSPVTRPDRPASDEPPGATGTRGELLVQARPWALVQVDGKAMGMTPRTLRVAPGGHTVKLTRAGQVHTRRVMVAAGRATTVFHDFGN